MAQGQEGQSGEGLQSEGRKDNADQPLNSGSDAGGAERYPSVNQQDAVERTGRAEAVAGEEASFNPSADAETPRENEETPHSANEGRLGPGADPVEGKR